MTSRPRAARACCVAIVLAAGVFAGCAKTQRAVVRTTQPVATTKPIDKADLALDEIAPRPVLRVASTAPATTTSSSPSTTQASDDRGPLEAIKLFAEGRDALLQGNRYSAIKLFQRAAALDPKSYEIRYQIGQASAGPGMSYDGAIAAYQQAADIDPDRVTVHFELGRLNLARGDANKAIEHLRRATLTSGYADEDDSAALVDFFLGRSLQQAGYDRAALDVYAVLIARLQAGGFSTRGSPELAYLVNAPETLFAQVAELCEKRGMRGDAIHLYRLATERKPTDFGVQTKLVRALAAAKKDAEARALAASLVQKFNASPASLSLMKETYRKFGGDEAVVRELRRLRREMPDDRSIIYALVDALDDLGREGQAIAVLSESAQRMRYPAEMVRRLGKLYDNTGDVDAGAKLIIDALSARPDATRELLPLWSELLRPWRKNHLTMARLQALQVSPSSEASKQFWISQVARLWGRDVLARTSLEQAVKHVPPFAPAHRALLGQYWARPDWDEKQKRQASQELTDEVERQGEQVLAAQMRGIVLLSTNEPEKAAKEFALARELGDNSADLQLSYATALSSAAEHERARQVLWKLIGDQPTFEDSYVQLFSNYLQAHQAEDAIKVLETWLRNDPSSTNAKLLNAAVLERRSQAAEAEKVLLDLFEREPDNMDVLNHMEQFYGQARADTFITKLEAERNAHPENRAVLEHLVEAYARKNSFAEAGRALDATRTAAANDPDLLYFIASLYTKLGQKNLTEEVLQQVVRIDAEHAPACNDLGYSWADAGINLERAESLVRIAVAREPDNQSFLDSLGWVLYKRAQFDEARARLEEAIGTSSLPDPVVLDHLGDTLYRLDRRVDAVSQWKRSQQRLGGVNPAERDELQQLRLQLQQKLKQAEAGEPVTVAPTALEPAKQAKN